MEFSTCPICNLDLPSTELQRHANGHFADEDCATDFEMAQQFALFPPSPPRITVEPMKCRSSSWNIHQSSSFTLDAKITAFRGMNNDEKHASLIHPQNMEKLCKVEGNLITLLKKCLEAEPGDWRSILCGHIDHFQSIQSWDGGWGCGWRNIQMLSSYLLSEREEARGTLYDGCGFVPNIRTLQCWLELAWGKGFDTPGSDYFDQKIYCRRNWIGTTECAALLRSFGLRARIVDFCSKNVEYGGLERKNEQVYGPMDMFVFEGKMHLDKSSKHHAVLSEAAKCYEVLTEWVWNYFCSSNAGRAANCRVVISDKSPLYFQHDGHSRTIIGIQAKHLRNGMKQYNLLILEPSHKTKVLEKSLRENCGWQKFIKRGAHTLKEPFYQVCFVDPGIARGEELVRLRTINSSRCEF